MYFYGIDVSTVVVGLLTYDMTVYKIDIQYTYKADGPLCKLQYYKMYTY